MIFYYLGSEVNALYREGPVVSHGQAAVDKVSELIARGASSIDLAFFTQTEPVPGEAGGGVAHAIIGTLMMVGAACLIGLPIGIGAGIFATSIKQIHRLVPGCKVEVLTPDFQGDPAAVRTVGEAAPDVFANNVETVRRDVARLARAAVLPSIPFGVAWVVLVMWSPSIPLIAAGATAISLVVIAASLHAAFFGRVSLARNARQEQSPSVTA